MPKIVHIADVHWRGLSRHEEYRESFSAFFTQVKAINPDLIYVGGDIVHSKTQGISPELIDCLAWWFQSLADICPTHVILGNHDGILMNKDRQDAISPVVTALNHPNLFLYKQSGVYPIDGHPGFNWCVFSCFDEEGWAGVKPKVNDVNIALFHGAVWGSTTDINWKIEGDVDTQFFADYDFALLGDIHKVQFLDADRRIAYCGSTIQQNYGESPGKGFLLWDIRSKVDFDVEFRRVYHSKPFITVDWAGSVPLTMEEAKKCPQGARYRVRTQEPIPHAEITQIKNELKITQNAAEVVFQDKYMPDTSQITVLDENLQTSDLRDPETQMRLLREYLSEVKLTDQDWELIEELVRRYCKTILINDLGGRAKKWSVKKMSFTNTFAYGSDNIINFEKMPGITGIFGRNRRGKSSVIGTMVYGLFNTTDRGAIKNIHVINERKNHCRVTIDLTACGKNLRVDRQSVRKQEKNGHTHAVTHLNFWELDENGEEITDLSAEQRRNTEKVLRSSLGTAEDFMLTSLASQGNMNLFIEDRATARKSTLTKFLDLDIFDQMMTMAKDDSSSIKAQVKSSPDRDWDTIIGEKIEERKNLKRSAIELESQVAIDRAKLEKLRLELSGFRNADAVTPSDVQQQASVVADLAKKMIDAQHRFSRLQEEEAALRSKIDSVEASRLDFDITKLRSQLSDIQGLLSTLTKLRHEHDRAEDKLKNQEKSASILETVPCGDQFPTCKFIKNSHRDRDQLQAQRDLVAQMLEQIVATESAISAFRKDEIESRIIEFDKLESQSSNLRLSLSQCHVKIADLQATLSKFEHQKERADEILLDLRARVVDAEVDKELSRLKSEIANLQNNVTKIDGERIAIASRAGRLEGDIEKLRKERDKYKTLRQKWRVYEILMQAMSRRGIPLQIIRSQLPVINAEISKILHEVVDFTVVLEADPDTNAMDVYIDYGDSRRIIEVGSGMEKLLASMAIRVALINVTPLPKPDMFIIDEGFGSLDDLNVEAVNRMLVSLKKWFRTILIITHVDAVKDVVDNVIDITKNGKDSQIVYE